MFVVVFLLIVHQAAAIDPVLLSKFDHLNSKTSEEEQVTAVQKLIHRLIPQHVNNFVVSVNSSYFELKNNLDAFEFESLNGGKISIRGTSGVAAAAGFYHYLKYWCNCHVSWSGDQLNMPNILPKVVEPVTIYFQERFRYYQNVCTVSYSMAFWNWTRWEKEIDWMALNGINLPLAFTGQETIWQKVYLKLGLTQKELDVHFAGPAFLAWQRMGNIEGWGGPLPSSWYKQQLNLQQNILKRMRNFGMIPVLPGFAGHVPRSLIDRLHPTSKFYKLGSWNSFSDQYSGTYLLDPQDPLFHKVGSMFINAQQEIYNGTDHIYNADVFNEMQPPQLTTGFMSNTSKAIYEAMLSADANAVWLMQAWVFLNSAWKPDLMKAWFNAIPTGKLILLDLASESRPIYIRTNAYYGHPFIWNMIENFGGTTRLFGMLPQYVKEILDARKNYSTYMIGTGMTPEGIEQNDVNFEMLNEMAWRNVHVELNEWIELYSLRRYGALNTYTVDAWQTLLNTIYDSKDGHSNSHSGLTVLKPFLTDKVPVPMWYDPQMLVFAWKNMVLADEQIKNVPFRYDLVRIGVQVLEDLSIRIYQKLINAYDTKNISGITYHGGALYELLLDMDELLCTDPYSLLGTWIESAKKLGTNDDEKKLLEFNARNQITLWGPNGEISDYASKNWAGLVKSYYAKRWQMFVYSLKDSVSHGRSFNQSQFNINVLEFEQEWNKDRSIFPTTPSGDVETISSVLLKKYEHFT